MTAGRLKSFHHQVRNLKQNTAHGDLTLVVYQSNRADLMGEKIDFSLFFDDSCVINSIPEPIIEVIDLESDL